MADDTILSAGVGTGDTIRDLDDGSRKWPVSALAYPTHVSTGPSDPWVFQVVDATHGAPVAIVGSVAVTGTFWQTTQPISAASLPLPSGAATSANQDTGNTSLASIDGKTPALGQALASGSVPVVLTAAQLALLEPFSTVAISNTVPVTGTFWQTTQPVSLASLPALAAGTAVIGHVIVDAGTAVIGHVIVDSGAITFSNTTIAVTNTGTFAVQATLSAETTKVIGTVNVASGQTIGVTGTFWQATQPVSAASLPLPSGASTSAKQDTELASLASIDSKTPALGQALAAGAVPVVLTTAQLTTLTPLTTLALEAGNLATLAGAVTSSVIQANVKQINGATVLMGNGVSGTGAQRVTLASDSTGQVTLAAGSAVIGHVILDANSGVDIGKLTANQSVNVAQINGVTTTMGNGVSGTGVQRVTIASDSTGQLALAAGSAVIGHVIVDSGTITTVSTVTTVTTVSAVTAITNALPAGTNNIGQVCLAPQTSGGLSTYSVISSGAANQDSAAVKGSAGQVYGYSLFNTTASARYVKLYNKASGATSGDTPVLRIYLPPTGGANLSMENGLTFGTGICIRITTGAADNDAGACSANDVLANVFYK